MVRYFGWSASKALIASERRETLHQMELAANNLIVEARRAEAMGSALLIRCGATFAGTGMAGSPIHLELVDRIEGHMLEAARLQKAACPALAGAQRSEMSVDEMKRLQTKCAQAAASVAGIIHNLEQERQLLK